MSSEIGLWLCVLSLAIWVILLGFWGQFWRCDQKLTTQETDLPMLSPICAIIPARNEADLLPVTLRSLLSQDYPGSFTVILVDDSSTDGTANVARNVAQQLDKSQQLHVLCGEPLPPGWTGKLWALHQGIQYAQTLTPSPDYFLLTDADIEHDGLNLRCLLAKAQQEDLDLVSLMVQLRCESFWEKLLIPAFVFFFQKLYPFRWVNNPKKTTAAAAGGYILIRRAALVRIGGIQVVRQALIDDCALAQAVKSARRVEGAEDTEREKLPISPTLSSKKGHIWLGLSPLTKSLRPYASLAAIWEMVARTAFTQLNYSPLLLLGTLFGMTLVYLVPPISAIVGGLTLNWVLAATGLSGWLLMTIVYLPTVRFYTSSPWLACCLPLIAFVYTLMTLDSALRHWQGRGGAWKGRVYSRG
ncbi:glycosyltransferase [Mastigocladopsis repens]|uniref:glycosyltransferase n=1 Tax=Mastigocladopsis repens TaxID=221287 RepID=UPI0003779590|nr:glycosyltransferase [Mastigocladopsis repens]